MKMWDYENPDFNKVGNINQIAGIRHYEFCDGKAKGVEAAEIHTGSGLVFTVLPGRGMDIAWTEYRGTPVNYMSKTGIVSPAYYENDRMEWLHSFFAGTLTTCGLLNAGNPELFIDPRIGERKLGLHGRISNTAAEQVSIFEDFSGGEYIMKVSGKLEEATLHAEHLSLRREITAKYGSREFTLHDIITNHASTVQDIMLLYHINFGYPLLDYDSRFVFSSRKTEATGETAEKESENISAFAEPLDAREEMGYFHDFCTDSEGFVHVGIVNTRLELGVELVYKKSELPCFNEWKTLRNKEYVLGCEPGNCFPAGYSEAKKTGKLDTLMPGKQKEVTLTYRILDGIDEITDFEKRVSLCTE